MDSITTTKILHIKTRRAKSWRHQLAI